jgi:hypothetical protein
MQLINMDTGDVFVLFTKVPPIKLSFIFNDNEKSFTCFACKTSGTYLKFIALMQGFSINALNEAKIFATVHFAHLNLGLGVRTKSWTEYTQEGDRGCIQRNNIEKPWRFMKKRNR